MWWPTQGDVSVGWSLLWGNEGKHCYQADCRRSCPSSNPRVLSWLLHPPILTLFLCGYKGVCGLLKVCLFFYRHAYFFLFQKQRAHTACCFLSFLFWNQANPDAKKKRLLLKQMTSLLFQTTCVCLFCLPLNSPSQAGRQPAWIQTHDKVTSAWGATGLFSHSAAAISFKGRRGLRLTF